MNNETQPQVFINGKAQIIEMLQIMPQSEKETLIKNLKMRNPQLAEELQEKSLTFEHLSLLNDHDIRFVIQYVKPAILGIALKGTSQEFQRKILTIIDRSYAEEAYEVMVSPISNERESMKRAQNKILGILGALSKKKRISL